MDRNDSSEPADVLMLRRQQGIDRAQVRAELAPRISDEERRYVEARQRMPAHMAAIKTWPHENPDVAAEMGFMLEQREHVAEWLESQRVTDPFQAKHVFGRAVARLESNARTAIKSCDKIAANSAIAKIAGHCMQAGIEIGRSDGSEKNRGAKPDYDMIDAYLAGEIDADAG